MSSNKSIDEYMDDKPKKKVNWAAFVESETVSFFNLHELEKMTVEDGNGNKAKLSRQKDEGIKVEYSSMTIL
jgi:hypothetical protein